MDKPRFDEPNYTRPPSEVLGDAPSAVPKRPPIPSLVEPPAPDVTEAVDEALVQLEHRGIRVLRSYWHGGWDYAVPRCWLRREVADRLGRVAEDLPAGWGLAVFDGWRPMELQRELYDSAAADPGVEPGFMAPVSDDPAAPPPHVTGGAVDLTLTYRGTPLAAGTAFDDTTKLAYAAVLEDGCGLDRDLRRLLYWSMNAQGFVVYRGEWWHFEYGTSRWAAITGNAPFYGPAKPERNLAQDHDFRGKRTSLGS